MPGHYRTRSSQRASVRERTRKAPIAPSARRLHILESKAETSNSAHLQAALALCQPRRSSAPSALGPAIVLRRNSISKPRTNDEDEDMLVIHRPDNFEIPKDSLYTALEARAFDWRQDPFEDSPVYVYGQRPNHKRQKSSLSRRNVHLRAPQFTLPSATPSPAVSATNSPQPSPLTRALHLGSEDVEFEVPMPNASIPLGWPGTSGLLSSPAMLSTPAFSTPGLSPSASSAAGSPYPGHGADYFAPRASSYPHTPSILHTPASPRPVPE
ncbi:hypothetical protein PIIN_08996 [Serendipita indica DSM 11827]|uniref:Uncharacterized protein n=1 Tax=Serendipita indica (strain DSM 11827) TaxID=1109443 RepID=G4TUL8_SERID|nr:hypothetical protein PIIN_08996 [Serendipita indica DSM 11827]